MNAQLVMMRPAVDGWSVCFADGRELARFRGVLARWRATRYLAALVRGA
jgi:hypothetical protein